jgi:hypothetical protein
MDFHSLYKKITAFFSRRWAVYLALLVIMLLPYLGQLTRLGYINDDMQVVYLARLGHPIDLWNYFVSDRPLSIWTYLVTLPWLGVSSPPWQLFTLLMRWLSVVGFMLAFEGLWPRRVVQVRWMGLLLAFYPGFHEQVQALAFSQHFIAYALFTLSLAAMIWSLRKPAWAGFLIPLAVLASIGNAATMEYFVGLEILRPVILWIMLRSKDQKSGRTAIQVLIKWLPYLLVFLLFAVWRFYFYPKLTPEPGRNNPLLFLDTMRTALSSLKKLSLMAFQDFIQVNLSAWVDTFKLAISLTNFVYALTTLIAGLLAAFALLWMLSRQPETEAMLPENTGQFTRQGLLLGVLAVLAGGLPVWLIGRQVIEGGAADRFSLAPMFGVVILLVCFIDWLGGLPNRRNLVLAVLLGLSISTQFRDVTHASQSWQAERQFFWQLYWRAPALKPGTLLLGSQDLVVNYFALNMLYSPHLNPTQADYWYFQDFNPDPQPGKVVLNQLRNIHFQGSTSAVLAVVYRPDFGCLKVLSPSNQNNPWLTGSEPAYAEFSNPGQIENDPPAPAIPPADIFGSEPPHDWCYYYEKADLAGQFKDWGQIVALDVAARQADLGPHDGTELMPFIEGLANQKQWQKAYQYTQAALHIDGDHFVHMCSLWQRIKDETPASADKDTTLTAASRLLRCSFE